MARRIITHSRKHTGGVFAVCNPSEWWSPRSAADVAGDIDAGAHTYWARDTDGRLYRIEISDDRTGIHAHVSPGADLLAVLPEC